MDSDKPLISADKIIEASKQWSLEGDCTLLEWMNQISKNLEMRANRTTSALSGLQTTVDRASVALSNATNNLAALQYSQFVENRVHDDDETLANVSEVPNPPMEGASTSEDFEVLSVLTKAMEKINSCHEAVTISYEDSDEEEPATNVVYRPKNPYDARPLPYLFGSDKWKEKWHVGLCDSDNDFSADENSDQFSESSSTAGDSYESTNATMSEWDSAAWGLNTNLIGGRKGAYTPSADGGSSNQGNSPKSETSTARTQRAASTNEPVEDQRYYQHVPRKQEQIFDDLFADSQRQAALQEPPVQQQGPAHEPIISNEPPPDVQQSEASSSQRSGAKKTLNLFDDDEFSSFMHQIVKSASNRNIIDDNENDPPKSSTRTPKKTVVPNLFDEPVEPTTHDLFDDTVHKPEPTKRKVIPNLFDDSNKSARPASSNLFDDIDEKSGREEPPKRTVVTNLFDDSGEESEPQIKPKPQPERKKVPNLFDDTDELFKAKPTEAITGNQQRRPSPKLDDDLFALPPVSTTPGRSLQTLKLFDDDDEDDDFDKMFAPKSAGNSKFTQKTKNLFEDDMTIEPQPKSIKPESDDAPETPKVPLISDVSRKPAPLTKKDLFDDVDDAHMGHDELFPTTSAKKDRFDDIFTKKETKTRKDDMPSTSKSAAAKNPSTFADIFQDEPPDDLFSLPTDKKEIKVADIFADDFNDDFDEIIPKKADSPRPTRKQSSSPTKEVLPKVPETPQESSHIASAPTSMISLHEDGINQSAKLEATPIPAYRTLFIDEPPPDDESPTAPSDLDEVTPSSIPAYGNINLFTDVPPDDDFLTTVPPVETKRIHSIFYDDFNETIEASRDKRTPASSYIFNDEPPPDDEPQNDKQSSETKLSTADDKRDKPKVSKLKKTDLQINVAALLPTTKIPPFRKPEREGPPPKADEVVAVDKNTPIPETTNRDLPENILPNLNRDRVKVQVKRRPSTRHARQESYRKSLIDEEFQAANQGSDENEEENDPKAVSPEEPVKLIPIKEVFSSKTTMLPVASRSSPPSKATTTLFEDTDSDDNGIFKTLSSKKPQPAAVATKVDSVIHSGLANIDNSSNRFAADSKPEEKTSNTSIATVVEVKFSKESLSSKTTFSSQKSVDEPTRPSSKRATLFGESDDDSDDLFKESKTPKKSAPKPIATQPVKPAASLFSSDDDDGSDDIFGKPTNKAKAAIKKIDPVKTNKPASSLFADLSDDDDDDLFGNAKKKPSEDKSKTKSSSSSAPTTQPAKTPAGTQQQPITSNNPLADLLDP